MAIYHCSCKIISRGHPRSNGQSGSAVASAAYRSGSRLTNEYDGRTHDYTEKGATGEVVHSEIMLCDHAPEKYLDRSTLWNAVEKFETAGNAQLAREYEVALPRELSLDEQVQLVRDFCQENFVSKGMIADFSIHDKGDGNPHAHIMLTMRGIKENGEWADYKEKKVYTLDENGERIPIIDENTGLQKVDNRNRKQWVRHNEIVNEWNKSKLLKDARKSWAECINRLLERKGLPDRVDHRSLKEQGKERIPTIHVGPTATNMERKAAKKGDKFESRRGKQNREIKKANKQIAGIDKEVTAVEHSIGKIRADMVWTLVHETAAEIRSSIQAAAWDEGIQRAGLENLARVEAMAAQTMAEQSQHNYHAEDHYIIHGKEVPYLDYQSNKAREDAAFVRKQITQNLSTIRTIPYYPGYPYGHIDVQAIREDFRAERSASGYKKIYQRSDPEKAIIQDVKKADLQLQGIYDPSKLSRLIEQQADARKGGRLPQSREEILVRQIQDGFANLRFMEQHKVYSYAQVKEGIADLQGKYNSCRAEIDKAEAMAAKLEKQDPTQAQRYQERVNELKAQLPAISKELGAYTSCMATLDRIDRESGRATEPIQPAAEKQKVSFDAAAIGKQLAAHRAAFVKATEQAHGLTSYQENYIYRAKATQITDCVTSIREHTASIESLRAEQSKLGLFQGKRKKELEGKITDHMRVIRGKETELKELGVADPAKADGRINELMAQAAKEKALAQAARENVGAAGRAEAAKAQFLELAKTVPESEKKAVFAAMEQAKEQPEKGKATLEAYKAELAALRELDPALADTDAKKNEDRQQTRTQGRGHGD